MSGTGGDRRQSGEFAPRPSRFFYFRTLPRPPTQHVSPSWLLFGYVSAASLLLAVEGPVLRWTALYGLAPAPVPSRVRGRAALVSLRAALRAHASWGPSLRSSRSVLSIHLPSAHLPPPATRPGRRSLRPRGALPRRCAAC